MYTIEEGPFFIDAHRTELEGYDYCGDDEIFEPVSPERQFIRAVRSDPWGYKQFSLIFRLDGSRKDWGRERILEMYRYHQDICKERRRAAAQVDKIYEERLLKATMEASWNHDDY
jgi:hypothetical protein